jgi:hypothetical protein
MLRSFAAQISVIAQRKLDRGVSALVWGGVIALVAGLGIGFLLAALQMSLALALGPIAATFLLGAVLLALAALVAVARRRTIVAQPTEIVVIAPTLDAAIAPTLPFLIFVASYVAVKTLRRRWTR